MWATMGMQTPYVRTSWDYKGKKIDWIAPEHCLLLVGYDDTHYIFNDPLKSSANYYYSKSAVEVAYKGQRTQSVVIIKDPNSPENPGTKPEYSKYQYGAVVNPKTDEIYPIMLYENGKQYIKATFNLKGTTNLYKAKFDAAKFISGVAFDDTWRESSPQGNAMLGGIMAMVVSGITAAADSLSKISIDINYYEAPSTGQKKATVRCGQSEYRKFFANWDYNRKKQSLKGAAAYWPDAGIMELETWNLEVDNVVKKMYGELKKVTPSDKYDYDLEYTFDPRRKDDLYVFQIFVDKDKRLYEYATMYDSEAVDLVVTKHGRLGFTGEEIERINLLNITNPVTSLSSDKLEVFDIGYAI